MPHDHLLLLREASPFSRGGIEVRLLRTANFGVYDFDDALHCDNGDTHGLHRRIAPKGPKAAAAVRAADRVIAGNAFLADWASSLNRDVVIIPTCVDPADYDRKPDYELGDPPKIGWIGSPANEGHLLAIADALLNVNRDTGARLVVVSGARPPNLGRLTSMVDRFVWSPASQRAILRTCDVGIMPLPNSPYERGKCGYKLLQYGAAGLPSVGSPVGVNEAILSAFGAPAPSTIGEWSDALANVLALDPNSRFLLAKRAHAVVNEQYSYDVWMDRWCNAVFGLV